jgi:hypothetical protein
MQVAIGGHGPHPASCRAQQQQQQQRLPAYGWRGRLHNTMDGGQQEQVLGGVPQLATLTPAGSGIARPVGCMCVGHCVCVCELRPVYWGWGPRHLAHPPTACLACDMPRWGAAPPHVLARATSHQGCVSVGVSRGVPYNRG